LIGNTEEIVAPIAEDQNDQAEGVEVLGIVQPKSLAVVTQQIGKKGQDRRRFQA